MSDNYEHSVLMLATYKLQDGVTEDRFASTNELYAGWLKRQPGFVSRRLSYSETEDQYIDVAYWVSLAAAQSAAAASMKSDECLPFFGICDSDSFSMTYAGPVASVVAVA